MQNTKMSISGLHCEVWQPEDFSDRDNCSSCQAPEFFIDLYVCSYASNGDETLSSLRYNNFRQRRDVLTEDAFSWSAISAMLSATNVPYHLQPFFIQQISARARGIAGKPNNVLCKIIPMVVELRMPEEEFDHYESDPQMLTGLARASRLSIEEIERVEVDGFSSCCAICLEEIAAGAEALRMPCLHFYHEACILRWLEQSSLCPLCRFQMPVEEERTF